MAMTIAAVGLLAAVVQADRAASAPAGPVLVIVYPFEHTGPNANLAERATFSFRQKFQRLSGYDCLDSYTLAEVCELAGATVRFDSPIETIVDLARRYTGGRIIVWGKIDRTARHDRLFVRALDLARSPSKLAVDDAFELARPTDLRFAVEGVIRRLTGRAPRNRSAPPEAEKLWRQGANLVPNPRFREGTDRLACWQALVGAYSYAPPKSDCSPAPIPSDPRRMVLWAPRPDESANRCLHYAMDQRVADLWGLACLSDWIPIDPDAIYRFACRVRSDGPTVRIFIKGYRRLPEPHSAAGQRREVCRWSLYPQTTPGQWSTATRDLHPHPGLSPERKPRWVRIDLYACHPAGHVWFDDVTLKRISPVGTRAPTSRKAQEDK